MSDGGDQGRGEYVTLNQAADLLGVGRTRMWQLARIYRLDTFELPTDRRVKLFRRADVEALREPRLKAEAA